MVTQISVREAIEFILNTNAGDPCAIYSIKDHHKVYKVEFSEGMGVYTLKLEKTLVEAAQTYLKEGRNNEMRKKGWRWKDSKSN